jgi:hypothetical protein
VGCISAEELCRPVPGHHDNAYPLGPHVSMPEIASLFCDTSNLLPSVASNSPEDSKKRVQRHLVAGTSIGNGQSRDNLVSSDPRYGTLLSIARACWPSNS